jgi:hypothetical protein
MATDTRTRFRSLEKWSATVFIVANVSRLSNAIPLEHGLFDVLRRSRLSASLVAGYGAVAYCGSYTIASVYATAVLDMWLLACPSVPFGLALTAIGVSGTRRTRRSHRRIASTRDSDRELRIEISLPLVGPVVSIAALGPLLVVFLAIHTAG